MSERLAPPIAGRLNVVVLCANPVVHIAAQDPIFDQIGFLAVGRFVINVNRAPDVRVRTVVDN